MSVSSFANSGTTQRFMAVRSISSGFVFASLCCHNVFKFNRAFRETVNRKNLFLGKIWRPCPITCLSQRVRNFKTPCVYIYIATMVNTGQQTNEFLPVFPVRSAVHVEGPWQPCCPAVQ